jgi:RNA polymerase sigma factor (TIGR02999 family)
MQEGQVPGEITALLRRWNAGDGAALNDLVELVYDELRSVAVGYLRSEHNGQVFQATELVSELYLRLARQRRPHLIDRKHFYSLAAMIMRRILLDHARKESAQKRPSSESIQVPLHPDLAWIDAAGEDMLSLDLALEELAAADERKVRMIELRYLLGCTTEEVAELSGVSRATVDRELQFAKAWLYRRLRTAGADSKHAGSFAESGELRRD